MRLHAINFSRFLAYEGVIFTLNRPGFLQIGMVGGGGGGGGGEEDSATLCNFGLNGPIDLKFGM